MFNVKFYAQAILLTTMSLTFVNNVIADTCNLNANGNGLGNVNGGIGNGGGEGGQICANADGSVSAAGTGTEAPVGIDPNFTPSTNPYAVAAFGISPNPRNLSGNLLSNGNASNSNYGAQFNTNALGGNTPTVIGNNVGQTTIYSNSQGINFYGPSGAGVQLHGIAPGTTGLDAVNLDQLNAATSGYKSALKQGLASVAAMSNVPRLDQDKMFSIGVGFGGIDSEVAYAAGAALRLTKNVIVNGTVGHAFGSNSIMNTTTWGAGAAIGW